MADMRAGFGEGLRFERERRGVSLARLSAETKVNPRHLEALEQGDYKVLPGGVFRRGIVRAYLSSVGLDEREWMPRFQASYEAHARQLGVGTETDPEGWATFAANVKRNRSKPKPKLTLRWLGVAALFLVVLAGAWAVWHFVLRTRLVAEPAVTGSSSRTDDAGPTTPGSRGGTVAPGTGASEWRG